MTLYYLVLTFVLLGNGVASTTLPEGYPDKPSCEAAAAEARTNYTLDFMAPAPSVGSMCVPAPSFPAKGESP
jgi:hypothetical protein